jgi:tetratricopeptide (TPR) repeat protein
MNISKRVLHWAVVLGISLCSVTSQADFFEGDPVPEIQAQDIFGKTVNLNEILEKNPDLVILFFFTPDNGKAIAAKLQALKRLYDSEALSIIALGMESDKAALQTFADGLKIQYFLLDDEQVKTAEWYKNVNQLPLTLFVHTPARQIERVLRGAGSEQANILKEVAENLFQQRKTEKASAVAASALENGEDASQVKELNGYILVAEGKLDEAEKEFGEIGADSGLAKVALERGDLEGAIAAADKAGDDAYAQAVKGEALIKSGDLEKAEASLSVAAGADIPEWQKSEAVNSQGRLAQANGEIDKAVEQYAKAQSLDQYNVEALSNEGAAYRERGGENDLTLAKESLEKAAAIRPDEMTGLMLQQVKAELEEANDIQKGELIKSLISDLSKRYEELKAKGEAEPADDWTSRPVVLAFLPGETKGRIVFDRAGTDMVLQREIEVQAQGKNGIQVVERVMLDKLLQELNLGSSELASGDTQRRLGQVLSAGHLGFIDFAQVGADTMLYLRLIDSETTGIFFQASQKIDDSKPGETVTAVVNALAEKLASSEPLQGLIADAATNDAVIINLGKKHGVKEGLEFKILQDGDPIEVGGKVIARRQKPVGKLTLTTVEEDYAIGTASNLTEGVTLAKEMKVQQLK